MMLRSRLTSSFSARRAVGSEFARGKRIWFGVVADTLAAMIAAHLIALFRSLVDFFSRRAEYHAGSYRIVSVRWHQ